jgi:hypothetical protein
MGTIMTPEQMIELAAPPAPQPDNSPLADLDWERLRARESRALDPDHQWAFDLIRQMAEQKPVGTVGHRWSTEEEKVVGVEAYLYRNLPVDTDLYAALPAPQPARVPTEAIGKLLAQMMDIAVANGANSVSMPDEYVEVAAWLFDIEDEECKPQPARKLPPLPKRSLLNNVMSDDWRYMNVYERSRELRDYARAALAAHGIRSEECKPQPARVPMTDEQIENCLPETIYTAEDGWLRTTAQTFHDFARAIEAAHGIRSEE